MITSRAVSHYNAIFGQIILTEERIRRSGQCSMDAPGSTPLYGGGKGKESAQDDRSEPAQDDRTLLDCELNDSQVL